MPKKAEARIRDMTGYYGWFRHKYGDVRYCIHCHAPLPKSENAPDYYVAQIGDWVEAKNNDASGTWHCAEIMEGGDRAGQRKFLTENGGYLFIELADGKAPDKAAAYLVPWNKWLAAIEPKLTELGMKSIRRETAYNKDGTIRRYGADILLKAYELEWSTGEGWLIPKGHIYWYDLVYKLELALERYRRMK